jgi:Ca2+-binding EF-hand superfamily protein
MDFNIEQINEEIKRDPLVRSAEAFDFFDRERRGRVGAAELTNLIRCCGQRPLDAQVKAVVDRLIERGDLGTSVQGTAGFSYDEFKMVLLEIHEENKDYDAHKALVNAFGAFDTGKDGAVSDGMVSVTKLKENLTTMGEVMTEYEINAMLKDIPQDNNMVPFMPLVERMVGRRNED